MEPMTMQLLESIAKDRDTCNLMASLFQTITSDMKGSQPVWEEFAKQASKLHACLRSTLVVVSSYLDAFQRVADTATNAKGASREIGAALTRICLRHRAVEAKVKAFASALMDCLIVPLQEKMDDWRKVAAQLEKDHAKEYRRHRTEVKKRSADALKQQRKRMGKTKSAETQRALDLQLSDVQDRYQRLETSERGSLAAAMIEERSRYCRFVTWLKPVVQSEVSAAEEMCRLAEVLEQLEAQTTDPFSLPPASEQLMLELKAAGGGGGGGGGDAARAGAAAASPPDSPAADAASSSLGSRKSSLCSISSLQSAGSAGTLGSQPAAAAGAGRAPPGPPAGPGPRVASVSSHDSGFTSQDTLFLRPLTPSAGGGGVDGDAAPPARDDWCAQSLCGMPVGESTTDQLDEVDGDDVELRGPPAAMVDAPAAHRPHTISNAYWRGGAPQRPSLGTLTFVAPNRAPPPPPPPPPPPTSRPPVPDKGRLKQPRKKVLSHYATPSVTLPDFNRAAPHMVVPQPVYANATQLRQMAALQEETAHEAAGADCALNALERCGSDGSNSSGYGSVSAAAALVPSADALPPPPDFVLYNFCAEPPDAGETRRPMSIAVPSEASARYAGLRRTQSQVGRPPPPPARRDSSPAVAALAAAPAPPAEAAAGAPTLSVSHQPTLSVSAATLRRGESCPADAADSPPQLRRAAVTRDPDFLQALTATLAAGSAASPPDRTGGPPRRPDAASPRPAGQQSGPTAAGSQQADRTC